VHLSGRRYELHLPHVHSLKEKRAVVKPIVEGVRRRYSAAAAEVDHQDTWQRAAIGVGVVSGAAGHATDVLDAIERFIWSFPEVEVTAVEQFDAAEESDA
jgi:uncharacterized protein YlxP (DUF503 family)